MVLHLLIKLKPLLVRNVIHKYVLNADKKLMVDFHHVIMLIKTDYNNGKIKIKMYQNVHCANVLLKR
jgi:hypothetical protein